MSELYVVVDDKTGEPVQGGGSSSPAFIRAFVKKESAERSARSILRWGLEGKPTVAKFVRVDV